MRYSQYLAVLWLWTLSWSASAIIMSDVVRPRLQLGFESLRIQHPDMDRQGRRNYFVSYHDSLFGQLGGEFWLMFAPDLVSESEIVDIKQDFYSLYASLSYHYVKLFRYSIVAGLGLIYERISYHILSTRGGENVYVPSLLLKFHVDYAVTELWEASLQLGFQHRLTQRKLDWSYGIAINRNF